MPAKGPPLRPSRNAKIPPRRSTMPHPDNHYSHKTASNSTPGIQRAVTYPVSSARLDRLTDHHHHIDSPTSRQSSSGSGSSASHSPAEPREPVGSDAENTFGGLVNAFHFLNPWRTPEQSQTQKVSEVEDQDRRYSGGACSKNMYAIEEE